MPNHIIRSDGASYKNIVNDLRIRLPNCPNPVIRNQLHYVIKEVLYRTSAWRKEITSLIVPGQFAVDNDILYEINEDEVALYPDADIIDVDVAGGGTVKTAKNLVVINNIIYANIIEEGSEGDSFLNDENSRVDRQLYPITMEEVPKFYPEYPQFDTNDRGTPRHIAQMGSKIVILPPSTHQSKLHLLVSLTFLSERSTNSFYLPRELYQGLHNPIFHGAMQRLLTMQDQPWTDLELAAYHSRQFSYKVAESRADANLSKVRASMYVEQIPFA